MTLESPCVWAEIFITQMKGKSGSWMVNGVEWADHLFFMLPSPFSTLPLLNSFPGGADPLRLQHLGSLAHGFSVQVSQ